VPQSLGGGKKEKGDLWGLTKKKKLMVDDCPCKRVRRHNSKNVKVIGF